METTQSQYDRIAAIFFLIIGGFFALYARSVEIGTWNEPGPGIPAFLGGHYDCDYVPRPSSPEPEKEGAPRALRFSRRRIRGNGS